MLLIQLNPQLIKESLQPIRETGADEIMCEII